MLKLQTSHWITHEIFTAVSSDTDTKNETLTFSSVAAAVAAASDHENLGPPPLVLVENAGLSKLLTVASNDSASVFPNLYEAQFADKNFL